MSRLFRRFRKEASQEKDIEKDSPTKEADPKPPSEPPPQSQLSKSPEKSETKAEDENDDFVVHEEPPSQNDDPMATAAPPPQDYNFDEYKTLDVNEKVREIFDLIPKYTWQDIELDSLFMPFVPEYMPAVGDVDAFIKIPRPDEIDDQLGLVVLDEPSLKQSDSTVLGLHLRAMTKEALPRGTVVKKLARADKNERELENWVKSISELHRSKPATNVHYSKPMPDVDSLMQEWPEDFEEVLKGSQLPGVDMDMSLEQYIDTICAILDIPVHKSRVQSLHLLFTLFSEFKNSQHFQTLDEAPPTEVIEQSQPDRLEL